MSDKDAREELRRGRLAYDEALRRALAIRETMAEHRRGKPLALPTGRRP